MEFIALKCLFKNSFDNIYSAFGFDKVKILTEVEKFLGKKLNKPPPE